jgi:hypothetical protein
VFDKKITPGCVEASKAYIIMTKKKGIVRNDGAFF